MHEVIVQNDNVENSQKIFEGNITKLKYIIPHLIMCIFVFYINILIIYLTVCIDSEIKFITFFLIFLSPLVIDLRVYFILNSKIINKIIFNSESKLIEIEFWCLTKGFQSYNTNIEFDNYEYYEKSLSGRRLHDRIFIISNKVKYEVDSFDFEKVEYDEIKDIIKLNGKNKYK